MKSCWLAVVFAVACGEAPPPKPVEPAPVDAAPMPMAAIDASVAADAAATASGLRITAIEPAKGDADGGTYAVIKGGGFLQGGPRSAKVYFGTRQGSIIRFQSDGELIVQAPGGKVGETVDLLVMFDPGGEIKLPAAFTFIDKGGGPSIDDLSTAPKGVTVVGAGTSGTGSLTADGVMQRIQAAYLSGVKRCYKDYLKKNGPASGKLTMAFTVGTTGKTKNILITGFAPPLDACIKTLIASWTFPVSKKDGTAEDVSFNVALALVPD